MFDALSRGARSRSSRVGKRFQPQVDALEKLQLLSHAAIAPGSIRAQRFLDCELYGKDCPKPPAPPTVSYAKGPGSLVSNYRSVNDDDIRFLYSSTVKKFTVAEANKSANSLRDIRSDYGSRPTGNFYLTLKTNQTVLLLQQDVDTKAYGYVAIKYTGSRWYTLTPNGSQSQIPEGGSKTFTASFGGSKIQVRVTNPNNDSTWKPNDIQYNISIV